MTDVAYVMCLDSLAAGSELFVHVSKPPKNGSATDVLLKVLQPFIFLVLLTYSFWIVWFTGDL